MLKKNKKCSCVSTYHAKRRSYCTVDPALGHRLTHYQIKAHNSIQAARTSLIHVASLILNL